MPHEQFQTSEDIGNGTLKNADPNQLNPDHPSHESNDNHEEVVDDRDLSLAEMAAQMDSETPPTPPEEPEEPAVEEVETKKDDEPALPETVSERARIAKRIAKTRLDKMIDGVPAGFEQQEPGATPSEQELAAQQEPTQPDVSQAQQPQAQPQPSQLPETMLVKIDGEEREVPTAEVLASYQIRSAADKRLAEATEIMKQAQSVAADVLKGANPTSNAQQPPQEGSQQPTNDQGKPQAEPGVSDLDYAAIAEKIQLGEVDEGKEALQMLVEHVAKQAQPQQSDAQPQDPEQVARIVQDRMISDQAKSNFAKVYADVVAVPELSDIAARQAVSLMIEDFRANGTSEEYIARAMANPQLAADAHRAIRVSGAFTNVRSADQLYKEAGDHARSVAKRLGGQTVENTQQTPNGKPAVPRAQRQRQALQSPQMRQAPPPAAPQTPAAPKSPSQVIKEMKVKRGQAVA